jgi:AcrR family transcriptional regulator
MRKRVGLDRVVYQQPEKPEAPCAPRLSAHAGRREIPIPHLHSYGRHVYTVYMKPEPTSDRIATEARKLLDADGVDAVTMRRVAAAVGITAMAVYRHYPDRDGLLNAVADEGFAELAARLTTARLKGDLTTRLRKVLDVNIDFALEQPRLFELMFLRNRPGARKFPRDFASGKSPTANQFAELIAEGIREGVFRDVDVWEIVFESGALLQGLVMLYQGGRVDATEAEFRKICHRAMERYLNGVRK